MDTLKALIMRYILLIPLAFCLCMLLVSQDIYMRLAALVGAIILEQARQWAMVSAMRNLAKGNKP
ncbi:MAG: hypothetical protein NT051_06405 [Candidatus Micrarchaeota archaeon]|nr:hypothetical protein [Candidatus Micrarchaeota archaeon]